MVVASAKRLRRRPWPAEDDTGAPVEGETHVGGAELAFLSALESGATPLELGREAPSSPPSQPPWPSSAGVPLRGVDVLQALQRKAAAGRKGGPAARKGGRGQGLGANRSGLGGGEDQLHARDYSNVRPLDIRSDWGARLDELDSLIQELEAQEHLYFD